jgi:hypothetical protein
MPIYKGSMEKARWGAVCPDMFTPVLMFEGKSGSLFGSITSYTQKILAGEPGLRQKVLSRNLQSGRDAKLTQMEESALSPLLARKYTARDKEGRRALEKTCALG